MSDVTTVRDLADSVGIPVEKLKSQLREALQDESINTEPGVRDAHDFDPDHPISGHQKQKLLDYLQRHHGGEKIGSPTKITLQRKHRREVTANQGHKVHVVVRKKRTYKKRTVVKPDAEPAIDESANDTEVAVSIDSPAPTQDDNIASTDASPPTPSEAVLPETVNQEVQDTVQTDESPEKTTPSEQATKGKADKKTTKKKQKRRSEEEGDGVKPRAKVDGAKKRQLTKASIKAAALTTDDEYEEEGAGVTTSRRRRRRRNDKSDRGTNLHGFEKPTAPVVREIVVPETVTVAELAQRMALKTADLIKASIKMGAMVTINQVLDQETAALIVEECGHTVKLHNENALEDALTAARQQHQGQSVQRAPVVTIMGHVDHGKTSLLDTIRRTKVTASEAGGITQHIGAYSVSTARGNITFLDTPGHAAFTAMRARGANCTDIVILVVAADDGVMPQTIEAIQHARAANVPIVVAMNKMDKEDADPERVRNELSQHEVISEEWGGDIMFVPLSAKTGEGVDNLLESVLLQSEVLELTAPIDCPAHGVVIESRLDKGRGVVATVLVQEGTLRKGDIILTGLQYGRVRAMLDQNGQQLSEAGPSTPIEVLGLSGAPSAADEVMVVSTERKAREVALHRQNKQRDIKLAKQKSRQMDDMFSHLGDGEIGTLNVMIKADVQGSAEALTDALNKLSTDEVKVNIIGSGVGGINESDVSLAMASHALLIGFNVRADVVARRMVEEESVNLSYFSVIYDVIETVKSALSGMLSPEIKEQIIGLAEVREVFRSIRLGAIAGCMVINGVIKRHSPIRVLRDNVVIYEGELESLRRFKEDVNEVRQNMECGIGVKHYNDVKAHDQIEVYERVEIKRVL